MMEQWKSVVGYEGLYEVSSAGNIRRSGALEIIRTFRFAGKDYLGVGLNKDGKSKVHRVHRLVALAFGIILPDEEVDHINNDKADNELSNLRAATSTQNHGNRKIVPRTHTSYKGIGVVKSTGRWWARIRVAYKDEWLGTFDTDIKAAQAYDRAAKRLFGKYARLNFQPAATEEE